MRIDANVLLEHFSSIPALEKGLTLWPALQLRRLDCELPNLSLAWSAESLHLHLAQEPLRWVELWLHGHPSYALSFEGFRYRLRLELPQEGGCLGSVTSWNETDPHWSDRSFESSLTLPATALRGCPFEAGSRWRGALRWHDKVGEIHSWPVKGEALDHPGSWAVIDLAAP